MPPKFCVSAVTLVALLSSGPFSWAQNAPGSGNEAASAALAAQINAVQQAQTQYEDEKRAAVQAEADREARIRAAYQRQAQERLATQRLQAEAKAKILRRQAKRDQDYQDELRKIQVQALKIKLQEMQTKADRENDIISARLNQQQAQTNVIQSQAHANRAISDGTKSLLEDTGKAEIKKSSGW